MCGDIISLHDLKKYLVNPQFEKWNETSVTHLILTYITSKLDSDERQLSAMLFREFLAWRKAVDVPLRAPAYYEEIYEFHKERHITEMTEHSEDVKTFWDSLEKRYSETHMSEELSMFGIVTAIGVGLVGGNALAYTIFPATGPLVLQSIGASLVLLGLFMRCMV